MKKILFIGPRKGGGVATINNEVIKIIKKYNKFKIALIDTSRYLKKNKLFGYVILYFISLYKILSYNPRVVYLQIAQTGYFHQSIFLIIAKLFGKEIIAHFHCKPDLKQSTTKFQLMKIIYSQQYIDKLIVLTTSSKKSLIENGWEKNIYVIHNFIDTKVLPKKIKTIKDKKYFLYIGRMHEQKGIFEILEIAKRLNNEKFIFIGSFSDKMHENKFKNKLKKLHNCKWLGAIYGKEKFDYINNSKFFIFPTLWRGEVFPLTLIETTILGTIPLVSPIGSIKEIITDNQNGFFISANDVENTVNKIKNLQKRGDNYLQKISDNAREYAKQNFTSKSVKDKLYDIVG